MYDNVYAIQGDWENPGDTPGYVVFVEIGKGPFYDSLGNQIDLEQAGGQWLITQNGGPIAFLVGSDPVGVYSDGFLVGAMCDLELVEASPDKRRSSLQLSHEEQNALGAIAFHVGATYRGRGSYRVLLRKILKGEVKVTKVNKNLLFGKVKGL